MNENPEFQLARRLIRSARNRAPSFILLNMIFNQELELAEPDERKREAVRNAARQILEEEK
jgi:hypothetical protein